MSFCPYCGVKISEVNEIYCVHCGKKLPDDIRLVDESTSNTEIISPVEHEENFLSRSINNFKHNQEVKKHEREERKAREAEEKRIIQADTDMFLSNLRHGEGLSVLSSCPILLKKNEEAFLSLNNVKLVEPRKVSVRVGGYGGTSIRVAKGVTFHTGGTRGRTVSHDELKDIDRGSLTLTNKRLVFSGSLKSVTCDFKKLLSVEALRDGVMVQVENRQKPSYFLNTDKNSLYFNSSSGRSLSLPVSGQVLQAAIQGMVSNL